MRTKYEATSKTNATGRYSLTAREPHTAIFGFPTKYQGSATRAPLDREQYATVTVKVG